MNETAGVASKLEQIEFSLRCGRGEEDILAVVQAPSPLLAAKADRI